MVEANKHVQQLPHGILPVQIEVEGLQSALAELAVGTDAQQNVDCWFDCPVPAAANVHRIICGAGTDRTDEC